MNSKYRPIKHSLSHRGARLVVLLTAAITAVAMATPAAATSDPTLAAATDNTRLTVFGLTQDQRLVRFQENKPQRHKVIGVVSGLQGKDSALVGIDFRVQDGQLYGVGNNGGIYTIDTKTAVATLSPASPLDVSLDGSFFGVDFNPAANALRIISDTGQNLRHPFAPGSTQFVTQTDDALDYPPATPPNQVGPTALGVTGAAYTNNDLDMNTGTTLYDIDTVNNQVAIQSPPNNGSLVPTGKLNVTVDPNTSVGFDIYTLLRRGVAIKNKGFASLVVGGKSGFYSVNFQTGNATFIGNFTDPVIDIAVPLAQ